MADVFSLNETPVSPESQRYATWKLADRMVAAGWEVWGSGNGTSFSTAGTNYWTAYTGALSSATKCWIALKRPGALQGVCLEINNGGNYLSDLRVTYSMSSWSSTSVSATVAPLAVGQTGYVRGDGSGYAGFGWTNSSNAALMVSILTIICRDAATDGSFFIHTWTTGAELRGRVHFSILDLPSEGILDPYIWYSGVSPTVGFSDHVAWNFDAYTPNSATGGQFSAFGTDGQFRRFTCGTVKGSDNALTSHNSNGWQSNCGVITSLMMYQTVSPYSRIGVPKWIKMMTWAGYSGHTAPAYGMAYKGFSWVQHKETGDVYNPVIPWDGATNVLKYNTASQFSLTNFLATHDMVVPEAAPPPEPIDYPTASISVGGMAPHEPRETVTFDYSYTGVGGSGVIRIVIYAYGDDGKSVLVYDGGAIPDAFPAPTELFEIVDSDDDGETGFIQIRPIVNKYWPLELCNWVMTVTSDANTAVVATSSGTIDTSSIPTGPYINNQFPIPGAIIDNDTDVEFELIGAVVEIVYVQRYGTDIWETVYNNSEFAPIYDGSTREAISGGYKYTVHRDGGWGRAPEFTATAIDENGNIL